MLQIDMAMFGGQLLCQVGNIVLFVVLLSSFSVLFYLINDLPLSPFPSACLKETNIYMF